MIKPVTPLLCDDRRRYMGQALLLGLWAAYACAAKAQAPFEHDVWSLRLPHLEGQGQWPMQAFKGKALLLHFWATWCPPCIDELPMLSKAAQLHAKHIQMFGIAVDQPSSVRDFLKRHPVSFPVSCFEQAPSLMKTWGNTRQLLPFSVIWNQKGFIFDKKIGKLSQLELNHWMKAIKTTSI